MTGRLRLRRLVGAVDPWLVLVVALAGWLRFSRIGDYDNQYYTATVASMLRNPHNFFFGSFDPGGVVMVDKPLGAFWVQAIFFFMFGMSRWAVNLPQAITGTLSILILYLIVRPSFGRVAAVAAALILMVTPASIVIDSRNEPDGLLSFTLLLAAFSITRTAETSKWRWLLAFSFLMGFAFNIKMLVAFVPLPAFLLYYLLAAKLPVHRLTTRVAAAAAVLLVVSLSWVTAVALTPSENRPYIGSTPDNSIWTLVFKYNGIDRFTSFIGPRAKQPQPGPQQPLPTGAQQPLGQPGQPPPQALPQPAIPSAANPDATDQGLLDMFTNPLAAQLGWLLPATVIALIVALVPLLSEHVYRRPVEFLAITRQSAVASQTVLWTGWLLTAMVVFGLANATTTHPYYLVGMAVPMAAVTGLGFALLWQTFRQGSLLSWVLPAALVGVVAYQVSASRGLVGDWAVAAVLIAVLLAFVVMLVALWRRLNDTPLARASVSAGALSLLIIPMVFGLYFGGPIAVGPGGPPQAPRINPEQQRRTISSFLRQQADTGAQLTLATVSAREASPFILEGVPALAIGGFSGGDPIFTVDSFKMIVERKGLRYFLMPPLGEQGGPPGRPPQEPTLSYIRSAWQDISQAVGLPRGSLYSYRGQ